MPEEKPEEKSSDAIKQVGEGLKSILERIAGFFDIFDLSFIVAGATAFAAIAFWAWRAGFSMPAISPAWVFSAGIIIACYVSGLVCFACGRFLRMGLRKRKADDEFTGVFERILEGHGLDGAKEFADYINRTERRGTWRLYIRLWAEVRVSKAIAPSFAVLNRYWVMAATYDGLNMALIVWAFVCVMCALGVAGAKQISIWLAVPVAVLLLISAAACSREANRYNTYQAEELFASIAAKRAADSR
jgi:hypothetical protein